MFVFDACSFVKLGRREREAVVKRTSVRFFFFSESLQSTCQNCGRLLLRLVRIVGQSEHRSRHSPNTSGASPRTWAQTGQEAQSTPPRTHLSRRASAPARSTNPHAARCSAPRGVRLPCPHATGAPAAPPRPTSAGRAAAEQPCPESRAPAVLRAAAALGTPPPPLPLPSQASLRSTRRTRRRAPRQGARKRGSAAQGRATRQPERLAALPPSPQSSAAAKGGAVGGIPEEAAAAVAATFLWGCCCGVAVAVVVVASSGCSAAAAACSSREQSAQPAPDPEAASSPARAPSQSCPSSTATRRASTAAPRAPRPKARRCRPPGASASPRRRTSAHGARAAHRDAPSTTRARCTPPRTRSDASAARRRSPPPRTNPRGTPTPPTPPPTPPRTAGAPGTAPARARGPRG
eukprot:Rhum_TRINITY_DN13620_c0_g1::Rhum_TRINITY_DN13620_c0_g1_i1::g.62094::m.62094